MPVESRMRRKAHVRFGGRRAETERRKRRHRAAGRPYLAQRAVDQVRRDEWNAHERSHTPKGRWIKGTRWSLLKAPAKQKPEQLQLLAEVQRANNALYRAFLLKEELRLLYRLERYALAPAHLDAWLDWASRSRLEPFVKLARTIRLHRHGILAAIRLGL